MKSPYIDSNHSLYMLNMTGGQVTNNHSHIDSNYIHLSNVPQLISGQQNKHSLLGQRQHCNVDSQGNPFVNTYEDIPINKRMRLDDSSDKNSQWVDQSLTNENDNQSERIRTHRHDSSQINLNMRQNHGENGSKMIVPGTNTQNMHDSRSTMSPKQ